MDKFINEQLSIIRYVPSLREEDLKATVPTLVDREIAVDEDGQKYGGKYHIKIPSWRELILAVRSTHDLNPRNLDFLLTTSYAVQARKEAYKIDSKKAEVEFPLTPCTVLGAPLTLDDKIICGIRGGQASSGKADIAGGYLNANEINGNPIFSNFRSELEEELGVIDYREDMHSLIGHFKDEEFNTLCFIMRGNTGLESTEILERHKEAYSAYEQAKKAGLGEIRSRNAIKEKGLIAVDAWEHHELFTIPNDPEYWQRIVTAGSVTHNSQEYKPLKNMSAAFRILIDSYKTS